MNRTNATLIIFLILLIASLSAAFYYYNKNRDLGSVVTGLETKNQELLRENRDLQTNLSEATQKLDSTSEALSQATEQLEDEESRLNPIRQALQTVAEDVAVQEKLAGIDPELLQKYSRVYFLNENYTPSKLSAIPDQYTLKAELFHTNAVSFLIDLLEDASAENIDLKIASAYRSFGRQTELKQQYLAIYGEGANQFSADQGYSEHQLGTTVDFVSAESNNQLGTFGDTAAYEWLLNNAHRYGFVLSYPEDNEFYQYEPWHWRFVGIDLADDLYDSNEFLYEQDERTLQEYRLELFD